MCGVTAKIKKVIILVKIILEIFDDKVSLDDKLYPVISQDK